MYDYFLGGVSYTPVDRDAGERIGARAPHWLIGARLNRAFVRRAVQTMSVAGIDQFLDLGSGIPTAGNVHELARSLNPAAKVVYVDNEPVAYEMARQMLDGDPDAAILNADLRDCDAVLGHPATRELIDFSRPVGLLAVGVLLFLSDEDDPGTVLGRYREHLVPGSYLALSQATDDCPDEEVAAEVQWVRGQYEQTADRLHLRSKQQIEQWFDGTELVAPGLVRYGRWRPEFPLTPEQLRCSYGYVGLGRIV
ncbi:SAM-dependent methyltransferase [Tsukamurella serpentis]